MTRKLDPPTSENVRIGEEAADWVFRLRDAPLDPKDPYFDPKRRARAFRKWITRSPQHLRVYLETRETLYRMGATDVLQHMDVEGLLADLREKKYAAVIPLFGYAAPLVASRSRRRVALAIAASIALIATSIAFTLKVLRAPEYATGVGEQITSKLEDGSVVVLNTDTRVRVEYSATQRHIELLRGEALFQVEHDASRPFTVSTNQTRIRAVGTQFNVRRRSGDTDVAVIEGIVQISDLGSPQSVAKTAGAPAPEASAPSDTPHVIQLATGEEARIAAGRIQKKSGEAVATAILWRQRRLSFAGASLAEVAAEFNRYNRSQIAVEALPDGIAQLSGIFDADRPIALIRYAQQFETLSVEKRGSDWVIRRRAEN